MCPKCIKNVKGYCCNPKKTVTVTKRHTSLVSTRTSQVSTRIVSTRSTTTLQATPLSWGWTATYHDGDELTTIPSIWKNTTRVTMPSLEDNYNAGIQDLLTVGKQLWGSGYAHVAEKSGQRLAKRDRGVPMPVYWLDETIHPLPMPKGRWKAASAGGIAYWQGRIVMVGQTGDWGDHVALFWDHAKNDSVILLPDQPTGAMVNGALTFGEDLYIPGFLTNHSAFHAAYWKNLKLVKIDATYNESSFASSLCVDERNGKMFVIGGRYQQSRLMTGYWADGVWNELPNSHGVTACLVQGTDLYIAGMEKDGEASLNGYYKNGKFVAVNVPKGYISAGTSGMNIVNNVVYIGGSVAKSDKSEHGAYWRDGKMFLLEDVKDIWGSDAISFSA